MEDLNQLRPEQESGAKKPAPDDVDALLQDVKSLLGETDADIAAEAPAEPDAEDSEPITADDVQIDYGKFYGPEEQKEITYDGSTYRQRSGLETYLIMGIDVKGKAVAVDSYEGGGQADVQMVLVVDDANKTWQVLQINRDTITKVPVLDVLGGVAAYADEQIALAHYYGNGRENSCENTALAVSMLLDDQPIDGYFALNMDAVGIVTDLVGGVTLTVTSDFSEIDPTLVQGEEVTLDGEKALTYVRSRHHIDDQTNIARMARQRQFLAALEEKLRQQDSQFAAEAYTALEDYMVTDIASGTAAKIGEKLKQYKQLDTLTIDGENIIENGYWAYHLDESSREATVLQLFYEKVR